MADRVDASADGTTLVNGRAYRDAMSRLSAQVHIVTTAGVAGACGVTVTAVTSVSDAPPTLLFCLNRSSRRHATVITNGVFCVNTLPAGATSLAETFAGRGADDMAACLASDGWTKLATGAPALDAALAAFDCRITEVLDVATHSVIFGEVVAVRHGAAEPALVYRNRDYDEI